MFYIHKILLFLTCVDNWNKHHSIEEGSNANHYVHLFGNFCVSSLVVPYCPILLIPVHPHCGNIRVFHTVDDFEENRRLPILEVLRAENLSQSIDDYMQTQKGKETSKVYV